MTGFAASDDKPIHHAFNVTIPRIPSRNRDNRFKVVRLKLLVTDTWLFAIRARAGFKGGSAIFRKTPNFPERGLNFSFKSFVHP
jgi:hypothetical protein